MNNRALLRRLAQGRLQNVSFSDFEGLVEAFGFRFVRVHGSHRFYEHPAVPVVLNLQPRRGEAKPYQIRQVMRLVQLYALHLEEDS